MHLWLWDTDGAVRGVAVQGGRKCQQSWYAKYLLTKHKHIYFIICALRRPCILSSPQPAPASSISLAVPLPLAVFATVCGTHKAKWHCILRFYYVSVK